MMKIKYFSDKNTYTITYVIYRLGSRKAIVVDPVLDFDPASGLVKENSVNQVLAFLEENNLEAEMCLETHAHADHLSGSQVLKRRFPNLSVSISKHIVEVQ